MSITGTNNPFSCDPVVFANANTIISLGTITRAENVFTFSVGFVWKISGVTYQNTAPVELTIAEATEGFNRIDNALLNTANTIELQQGAESETIALRPVAPDTNIILTTWNISGETIGEAVAPTSDATKEDKVSGVIAFGTNDYTATVPEVTELIQGFKVLVTFENTNTISASTLNVNGIGAFAIAKNYSDALAVNDLKGTMWLMFDTANWVIVGAVGSSGGGGGSSIVDASPIASSGETVLTFDNTRYYQKTVQSGDITLSLNPTGNLNGRVQVIDIDGNSIDDLIVPSDWINSNGIAFDNEKNNVIYLDYINGKVKYNITKQNLPDTTPPVYLLQNISDVTDVSARFNVEMNENCDVFYYLSDSATPPSKATILDGTGSVAYGAISAIANTPDFIDFSALTLGETYYLYSYAVDIFSNETAVQTGLDFTTATLALASDNFNGADVTSIVGRTTPVGGYTWAKEGAGTGTLGIVSNALKNTGVTANLDNIYTINLGVRNVDISVKLKVVGTPGLSNLEFARIDDSNRYYITSGMQLRKVIGGSNSLVSAIGGTLSNGDIIRCVLTSTTITVYKNGVSVYTGSSDAGVSGGKVGLYVYQDNVVEFEDFIVY